VNLVPFSNSVKVFSFECGELDRWAEAKGYHSEIAGGNSMRGDAGLRDGSSDQKWIHFGNDGQKAKAAKS